MDALKFCAHCGEPCSDAIHHESLSFCCTGCKQVYLILQETNACDPAMMATLTNISAKGKFNNNKWDFLDEPAIASKLFSFSSASQVHLQLKLPNIHCSSCIWLLEHMGRMNKGILSSTVDFDKKEISLVYNPAQIKLSELAALLDYIGYAPEISLASGNKQEASNMPKNRHSTILRIGVAGFCFSNIMMLSFPDYLAENGIHEELLHTAFSYISVLLSIPVILYGAAPFFIQAWKGLRQRFLNIDAPIALAIIITFSRSLYEIFTYTGTGYLDSMSGIVFFMLIGRWFQERTQQSIAFNRDYQSYFPMSSLVLSGTQKQYKPIHELAEGDRLLVRNQELIPADATLLQGDAWIDYSFVTGEKDPVHIHTGENIFAGGKQMGTAIEVAVLKPVSASHLTRLWNNDAFHNTKNKETSFIHPWSNYFSIVLFSIALAAGLYWQFNNPDNTWRAVTSVLIVACPCSLLLSATFTFGNMIRVFSSNGLFLKNATVMERMSEADTLVFDKTGTLTTGERNQVSYVGKVLSYPETAMIKALAAHSNHPLSRTLAEWKAWPDHRDELLVTDFREISGQGIEALVDGIPVRLGKAGFVANACPTIIESGDNSMAVHISINGTYKGKCVIRQDYRDGIFPMLKQLQDKGFALHILSGDNNREEQLLKEMLGEKVQMAFNKQPEEKLEYIRALQEKGRKVIMVGDGLNDAGALQQSDAGIAVTQHTNYFTPACDGILAGDELPRLHQLLQLAKASKKLVGAGFTLSIVYNIIGMYFSTQALLSPMIAAILMPASTISIILLSYLSVHMTKIMSFTENGHPAR
jgi:Cu+-exporting ATPase